MAMIETRTNREELPEVQRGIRRVYDEASSYYRNLRWEKNRLTRFERDLTRQTIDEELGPDQVPSILELGCGPGTWTGLLAERAMNLTAVDISAGMLAQAKRAVPEAHVSFLHGDAVSFRSDQTYDRVVSIRVLEYIPEWRSVVANIGSLVKPGGRAVLVTKTPLSVWRGTGRERWFTAGPRRLARRALGREQPSDFWQRHIPVHAMSKALRDAGFTDIHVRPVIFGLPVFVRGTMQYPLVPEAAEPALLRTAGAAWRWVSRRGAAVKLASLVFSESYAISGRRL